MEKKSPCSRLATLLLLLATVMGATAHVIEIDGIYYDNPSPSNLRVTTNNGLYNSYSGDVVIPTYVVHNGHTFKVSSIDTCAFRGCTELTRVIIECGFNDRIGVTSIGKYAFYDCPQLKEVILPDGITEIKEYTFANCTSLDSIDIPVNVTTIGEHAFDNCKSLSEIDLPYQVSSVGSYAFADCSTMTNITLPASLKSISDHVFFRCLGIAEVVIPNSTTSIGESAFQSCNTMKRLVLGEGVNTISKSAFRGCIALEDVICKAKTIPNVSGECFSDATYNQATLHVRKALFNDYTSANYWRKFKHKIVMPYEIEYEGIYYVKNTIYSVEVGVSFKDYGYNSYKGDIVIPNGFPYGGTSWKVKTIEPDAFRDCDSLTSVTFPSLSITSIGDRAFMGCTMLPTLSVPASVTQIGNKAFAGCTALGGITLPNALTILNDSTFAGCKSLSSLTLPNSVKSLGADIFSGCESLETITIGENTAKLTVDEKSLNGCTALKSITCKAMMPPLVTGDCFTQDMLNQVTLYVQPSSLLDYRLDPFWGRFANIKAMTYDFVYNGIYYIITSPTEVAVSNHAPEGGSYTASAITIPDKVAYAGDQYTVTAINKGAFKNSTTVNSVSIPETVTSIGKEAFKGCRGLKGISFPRKVSVIDDAAFMGCSGLKSVTIPNTIEVIEDSAFYACTGLTSIDLGTGVEFIGNYAFAGCYNLPQVFIPANVIVICSCAFQDCTNLSNVTIDINHQGFSVDGDVFRDCYGLTTITCLALTPPELDNQRGGLTEHLLESVTLMVPHSLVDVYRNAEVWGEFANIEPLSYDFIDNGIYYMISGDNTVSVTHNGKTNSYSGIIEIPTVVYLDDNSLKVTAIEPYAFYGCSGLKMVTVPNTVTEIGSYAFAASNVYQITLSRNITEIKEFTFAATNLSSITIPDKVTKISDAAFFSCADLHDVVLPEGLQSIGEGAFLSAGFFPGYLNINLPNTLIHLGNAAFMGSEVHSITIPNSLDSIPLQAFAMCMKLQHVTIPSSIKKIGFLAFYANNSLKNVVIPNSVKSIDYGAFMWCDVLDNVTIGSGIEYIDEWAFGKLDASFYEDLIAAIEEAFGEVDDDDIVELLDDWREYITEIIGDIHPISSVTCTATTPPTLKSDAFAASYNWAKLNVPQGSLAKYKNADEWKKFVYINADNPYDVNSDGEVNIADVNCVIDAIISEQDTTPRLDANHDGEINIADVNSIIDNILQGNIHPL